MLLMGAIRKEVVVDWGVSLFPLLHLFGSLHCSRSVLSIHPSDSQDLFKW